MGARIEPKSLKWCQKTEKKHTRTEKTQPLQTDQRPRSPFGTPLVIWDSILAPFWSLRGRFWHHATASIAWFLQLACCERSFAAPPRIAFSSRNVWISMSPSLHVSHDSSLLCFSNRFTRVTTLPNPNTRNTNLWDSEVNSPNYVFWFLLFTSREALVFNICWVNDLFLHLWVLPLVETFTCSIFGGRRVRRSPLNPPYPSRCEAC